MNHTSTESPGLDLSSLENVKPRGDKIEARCPACQEEGRDRSGNHLVIYSDGKFGCTVNPGDEGEVHRKRIWTLAGSDQAPTQRPMLKRNAKLLSPKERELTRHEWDFLEVGTKDDLHRLSDLREIGIGGLRLASGRGVLRFFTCEQNGRCWTVTDDARFIRQDRRLDGEPFILVSGGTAKSRSIGTPQSWPIGLAAARNFPIILFVEGSPDLLAAFHLIYSEGREIDASAVMLTGTGQHIHGDALPMFKGQRVRIFPDADSNGEGFKAGAKWEAQLREAGADVDAFDLRNLDTNDGRPVKDVNDFLNVDVDSWEQDPDIRCSIPQLERRAQ